MESHDDPDNPDCMREAKERALGDRINALRRQLECSTDLARYLVGLEEQIAEMRTEKAGAIERALGNRDWSRKENQRGFKAGFHGNTYEPSSEMYISGYEAGKLAREQAKLQESGPGRSES